ncbi:MAG: metallophosphoesterase [Desulfurellaceae bacterium]|nr:metallophosphoesterase [Desulfurellaceae bacterium]
MTHASTSYRQLRRWQYGLILFLTLGILGMSLFFYRRALFFTVLVPIGFAPFSYARLRLHAALEQALGSSGGLFRATRWLGLACDIILAAQFLTGRWSDELPLLHAPGVSWVGAIWYSAYLLLFFGYMGLDLWSLGRRGLKRLVQTAEPAADSVVSPQRRRFLRQAGALGVATPFMFSASGVKTSYDLQLEERELVLPHWPRELDGLRVAHLSDIHVGGYMNRRRLLHMADLTNSAKADVILHTGDFLTHRVGDFDIPLYEALARIQAPYGQWACLGNHDFDNPTRLVSLLDQAGVHTLRNALVSLSIDGHKLEVVGLDYFLRMTGSPAERYAEILRAWQPQAPRILLNHDPRGFELLPDNCADLVLSGHTHGGHIGIPLGQDTLVSVIGLLGIPDQGIFQRGDMRMFVTRCVGFYGYPMRLGIAPEIALLTLRSPSRPDTEIRA